MKENEAQRDSRSTVLVTGGTGFVAGHCILRLLENGYRVRATVRSVDKAPKVFEMMKEGGFDATPDDLEFVETDLTSDRNWNDAAANCEYVLHVASPIFIGVPKHEDEMIVPAVDGTLRVLRAARDAGVKRVVITSSFAAVGYSHTDPNTLITEEEWTDPADKTISPYIRSKALAERAAWDFIESEGDALELSVVNPVGIFGPSLGPDISSGFEILQRMLQGTMKALPNFDLAIVDVRDLADLHLKAMTDSKANGERFLALAGGVMSIPEIAEFIRDTFGERARKVPRIVLPDWGVRLAARFSESAKAAVPLLGRIRNASNEKAKTLLGWTPRSNEEAIRASVESLFKYGNI